MKITRRQVLKGIGASIALGFLLSLNIPVVKEKKLIEKIEFLKTDYGFIELHNSLYTYGTKPDEVYVSKEMKAEILRRAEEDWILGCKS